jgi:hypothetical protein
MPLPETPKRKQGVSLTEPLLDGRTPMVNLL